MAKSNPLGDRECRRRIVDLESAATSWNGRDLPWSELPAIDAHGLDDRTWNLVPLEPSRIERRHAFVGSDPDSAISAPGQHRKFGKGDRTGQPILPVEHAI